MDEKKIDKWSSSKLVLGELILGREKKQIGTRMRERFVKK